MPTTPRSRAISGLRMPVVSRRSRVEEDSRIKSTRDSNWGRRSPTNRASASSWLASQSKRTPPGHAMPRKRRLPVSCSFSAQDAFLEAHRVGVGDHERHVGRDGADVGDMVVESLEFEADGAQRAGAGRGFHARRRARRRGKRRSRGRSSNRRRCSPPGRRRSHRDVLEELLGALVRVEEADLEIEHRFARDAEEKCPGSMMPA